MLASRTSSAFICLRCEAQLARTRLSAFNRRTNFSTSTRRHDGADGPEALSRRHESSLKITKEVQPLNRIRRRKGKVIRETSASLGGLKRLGEDADVLVLREVGETTPEEPTTAPEVLEPVQIPDILASLQQEGKALTPEDIYKQIEGLRPKHDGDPSEPHHVTQSTFVKLMRILTSGFTQQQLSAFYSVAKNIRQDKVFKEVIAGLKGETGTAKRPIERTEWQPGTSSIYKRLPGLDVSVRSKRQPVSKQLLVDRILRDVWKLVLLEEIEAPGELELSLKPWQITLLNAGENESMLDKIGRTRRARFEIYRQHNVLRITADKNTAEYAANDLVEVLQNTEVRNVSLKPWLPLLVEGKLSKGQSLHSLFAQSDLDMISSLTRTSIEWKGNTITITGFDSTAAAEAERTLIKLLPLTETTKQTIDTQKVDAARGLAMALPVYLDNNSLDHTHRHRKYSRHTLPIMRQPSSEHESDQAPSVETPATTHGLINRVVAAIKRPCDVTEKLSKEDSNWTSEPEYKLSAEIGQVLFPIEETDATENIVPQSPPAVLFSPNFPGLSTLLISPSYSATARHEIASLLYEFIPAPSQPDSEPGQHFPSLQIQMRTGHNGRKTTLHKLSLGFDQCIHDVLLPDQAADLRFYRSGRLRLQKCHNDSNVQAWTDAVIENIESGGRLSAPNVTMDIPRWTIPGEKKDAEGMRRVTYLFSGIQFRQSISGQFSDTAVSYSTVQSGKLGTKGGVFAAHYTQDVELRDEDALRGFVECVLGMVGAITQAAGQTVPISRRVLPRSESARKMRRAAQGASASMGEATGDAAQPVLDEQEDVQPMSIVDAEDESGRLAVKPVEVSQEDKLHGVGEPGEQLLKASS